MGEVHLGEKYEINGQENRLRDYMSFLQLFFNKDEGTHRRLPTYSYELYEIVDCLTPLLHRTDISDTLWYCN